MEFPLQIFVALSQQISQTYQRGDLLEMPVIKNRTFLHAKYVTLSLKCKMKMKKVYQNDILKYKQKKPFGFFEKIKNLKLSIHWKLYCNSISIIEIVVPGQMISCLSSLENVIPFSLKNSEIEERIFLYIKMAAVQC